MPRPNLILLFTLVMLLWVLLLLELSVPKFIAKHKIMTRNTGRIFIVLHNPMLLGGIHTYTPLGTPTLGKLIRPRLRRPLKILLGIMRNSRIKPLHLGGETPTRLNQTYAKLIESLTLDRLHVLHILMNAIKAVLGPVEPRPGAALALGGHSGVLSGNGVPLSHAGKGSIR